MKQIKWWMVFLAGFLIFLVLPPVGAFVGMVGSFWGIGVFFIWLKKKHDSRPPKQQHPQEGKPIEKTPKAPLSSRATKKPVEPASVSDWNIWNASVHLTDGQAGRMQRVLMQKLEIVGVEKSGCYRVRGWKGNYYSTDYKSCTCEDFQKRRIPCKHMYLLATEKAGFNPIPYIIRSNVEPHPLRGYMNMGRYKVKGKNPETGRVNTRTVYAVDEAEALKFAKQFKLLEPLRVEEVPYEDASDYELDEARQIGVFVPAGAKSPDVVASIQRYKNIDEATIHRSEWEYAASVGIKLSALDGVTRAKIMFREAHKRWRSDEQLAKV